MSDDEHVEEGKSEARVRMEQDAKRRKEKAEEEWKEYEEFRREERQKEEEEIQELRERRERRKQEREEEEKRLAEQRAIEDQKRKSEEEERQRKKREEEQRKREEREAKQKANEARSQAANRPNFVITKKTGGGPAEEEVVKKEETKTKEQLEAERKAVLEQRIQPLSIDGMKGDQLKSKAKELHDLIMRLEGDKYDLEQRFTRQNYEMQELAERARQMNKGGKTKTVQNEPDPLASKISGLPPKIVMYSEYERIKDHRSFGDRKTVFGGPLYGEEYTKIPPTTKVVMTEAGFKVDGSAPAADGGAGDAPAEVAADVAAEVAAEE